MRVVFSVCGEPKGQPRVKAFARRLPGGGFAARVYDPGTAEGWKSAIAVAARDAGAAGLHIAGPVSLVAVFYFQRPRAHYGSGRNAARRRESAPCWHTGRPDLDNVVKAAKDALTQVGVWRDDAQVCEEVLQKRYADGAPFAEFIIETLS